MYGDNIWFTLWSLVKDLWALGEHLLLFLLSWSLLIVWTAWWLWAVNWQRTWEVLRRGAWAPFVLLMILAALVWAQISPGPDRLLGLRVGHFWWHLGCVSLIAAYTLFLGYVQGVMGWTPEEISLEPPAHADGHDAHGHTAHSSHGH